LIEEMEQVRRARARTSPQKILEIELEERGESELVE
jgi:hypothetical protein